MRHFKILIGFLIFAGLNLHIYGQNYLNVLGARLYYVPVGSLKDMPDDIKFNEYRIEGVLPIELNNGNTFGIKAQYKKISLHSDNVSLKNLDLHTIKLPLFAFIGYGESKWSSYLDINPKLNTDFKNVTSRHFQIGGMFIVYYEKRAGFYWQLGMFYNQDTYGPFFMPLLGVDWQISERSYFAALLPAYIIFEKRLGKRFYAGFEMELSGETFRLGGSDYKNSFISQLGENKLTFLTEPHLFLDFYISKHLVIYIKPGMRLFQKYEHYTEQDERIEVPEYIQGTLENSFYTEFGLALRFRYDEE